MRKKFTMLLASLFLTLGTAWAYQLSYDKTTWTVPATIHEKVTTVPADVFTVYNANYSGQTELASDKVGVYAEEVTVTGGTVTVTLAYTSGNGSNIRLDICGVDLVANDGSVVYQDYHFGWAGGSPSNNTYTLNEVVKGSYTLRVFVASQKEDFTNANNNSRGNMTVTGAAHPIVGSTAENKIFYNIKNVRSGKYANYEGANVQFTQVSTLTLGSYWYLMEVADAQDVPEGYKAYRIYNAANALAVENPGSGNMTENTGVTWPAKVYCIGEHTNGGTTGVVIRCLGEDAASWNDAGGSGTKIANHTYDDPGSIWEFEKTNIAESQLIQNAVATKTAVLNTLTTEATNTQRYFYGYELGALEAKKAEIEAISVPENSLIEALTNAITISKMTSLAGLERIAPKAGDKFAMVNKGRNNGKDGLVAFAAGTDVKCLQAPFAYFDALWTLVATETEGQFKLYNEKLNVYVGVLSDANDTQFQYVSDAADAGVYELANVGGYATFKKVGGNNYSHMHQSGWGGKEIVRWDNGDCSQWQLVKPFGPELTTDVNSPICYALKSGRDNNYYFTLDNNKVKLFNNKTVATDETTHWYFMLDGDGHLKMYSKSDNKAMGYLTGTSANTRLTNDVDAAEYDNNTYILYFAPYNQTNYNGAWFALKPSRNNTYVSNHGGTANYMGFHTAFDDGGTRIAFENVDRLKLEAKIAECEAEMAKVKDAIGYYSVSGGDAAAVLAAAKAALQGTNSAAYRNSLAALEALTYTLNVPEVGKYYRIKGNTSGNYIDAAGQNNAQMNMKATPDPLGSIFLLDEGNRLKNMSTGTYVYNTHSIGATKENANTWEFISSSIGYLKLKSNYGSPWLHDSDSKANRCQNDGADHEFVVMEVTSEELNELNESYLNGCSYITTLAENSNHPVIVNNARSNWAMADNPTALNTLAKLGMAKAVFDTKQQFAFITPDGGENYYLYSVHAKRYLKSNNTLGAQGEPIEFIDASSQGENKVQVRFKGVEKYINVGGENQMVIDDWSTIDEGNACELVQCNTLTFDLDEALDIFNNGAYITMTYKFGDKQVTTTTYKRKDETFSFNNPSGYTSITSCKMDGADLTPTDGTYSFTVTGDANIVVELLEEQLPFTLSENYENAVWYRLKIRPNANPTKWVVRKAEKPYDNVTTAPTDDNGLWAFVGNVVDGIQVLNKEAGANQTLGFDNMNTNSPAYMKEETTTWTLGKLAKDGYEGFLLRQGTTGNNYLHDYRSKLAFWNDGGASTDLGSAFVAEAPLSITYMLNGEELTEQKVDVYVNYGATYTIVNPCAGATEFIAIGECNATGSQPVNAEGTWSVKVTEATSITVTLVDKHPFEYAADVASITEWYYLKLHSAYRNYLYYETEGEVLKADITAVDANNRDAYTWAFVGDPIGGFKLYNKAAGKYLDAVEAGAVVSATEQQVFKLTKSSYAVNGFFMQAKDGDYTQRFNMNGGVVYWSGADAGSTFMVELRPKVGAAAAEELLEVNENNHSAIPALGQYTTEAYEALQAAYEAPDATTESIEVAIAAFKASLNRPAYIITSAWDAGYPAGSAIYYDGAWKWKKASRYDRQMWMTIPGYTNEDVPTVSSFDVNNPSYGFCDYSKGAKMRNWDVQIVAVPGWPDAYSLQYSGDTYYKDAAMHAQSEGALVGWLPAALNDCQPSAWRVEYIGNTYDLDQLTNEKLNALAALQVAFDSKSYLLNAEFGEGVGKYQGDGQTVKQLLFEVAGVLSSSLRLLKSEDLTVDEINAYTAAINALTVTINLPEDGKYYRIYGANSNVSPAGRYITNHTNADGGRIAVTEEADASTVYYYKDDKLQTHLGGKFIGVSIDPDNYKFADSKDAASDITFAASSYVAGAYTIHSADCYLRYKVYNGEAEVDRGESEESANDAWYLQEVTKQAITYIYMNGKTELARQEVAGFIGLPYPAADAALPLGYVAPATLEGTVSVDDTEKVIVCAFDKSQMPFQYADSYENIEHWYYLNIAANGYYLYHADGADHIALNKTAVDADNKAAYSWAFIGNPTDGFQIVNKAKGEGWILSSSTTMSGENGGGTYPIMTQTPVPSGNNTCWVIHSKSANRANRDGFYLKQKDLDANILNNRDSKLAYWTGGADAGSTLVAVEQYEMTQLYSGVGSWEESPVYPEGLKNGAASGSHGSAADHVGAAGHTIYKSTKAIVTTEADVTVSFNYDTGDHGLITLGVDVVNGNGDVVASDYHVGFTGGAQDNKLYTLRNLPAGNYILRYYVCDKNGNHELSKTGGNIVVTYAKELTDVNAASALWIALKGSAQHIIDYKGEGLGYYNNTDAVEEKVAATPENTVAGYTAAFVALDDAIDNAFFALPEAGKFYRIKSKVASRYVTAPANTGVQMIMSTETSVNNILYLDSEKHLLVYGTGYYINGKNHAILGYKDTYTFEPSKNGVKGALAIKPGTQNYWHDNTAKLDAWQNGTNENCDWIVEEVTTLPVTVTAAQVNFNGATKCVSTLFAPVALEVPAGITAYIGVNEDNYLAMEPIEEGIIPANTGVILMADEAEEAKTYDFAILAEAGTAIEAENNIITGTVAKTIITPAANTTCYVLAMKDEKVGLYRASLNKNDGKGFINNACKAYIPVTGGQNAPALVMRFGRGQGTTEIELPTANGQQPTAVYDLQGRRVLNPTKGMYIINGKKVVIR